MVLMTNNAEDFEPLHHEGILLYEGRGRPNTGPESLARTVDGVLN